jgi:hypothetical protein
MQFVHKANEKQIASRSESHNVTYRTSGTDDIMDRNNRFPKTSLKGNQPNKTRLRYVWKTVFCKKKPLTNENMKIDAILMKPYCRKLCRTQVRTCVFSSTAVRLSVPITDVHFFTISATLGVRLFTRIVKR